MNKCQYCSSFSNIKYIKEINKDVCFQCLVKNAVENLRRKKERWFRGYFMVEMNYFNEGNLTNAMKILRNEGFIIQQEKKVDGEIVYDLNLNIVSKIVKDKKDSSDFSVFDKLIGV